MATEMDTASEQQHTFANEFQSPSVDPETDPNALTGQPTKETEKPKSGTAVGGRHDQDHRVLDVISGKPCKICFKILIPVEQFPKFNFVGKILGPKGNSLKRLQESTGTRMAVLGRGSMRDKAKEDQMRLEGGKYEHLNEPLHVWIEAYAQPAEALRRMAHAVAEVKKYLNPEYNDDIRQQQLEELMALGEVPSLSMRGGGSGGRGGGAVAAAGNAQSAISPGNQLPPASGGPSTPRPMSLRGGGAMASRGGGTVATMRGGMTSRGGLSVATTASPVTRGAAMAGRMPYPQQRGAMAGGAPLTTTATVRPASSPSAAANGSVGTATASYGNGERYSMDYSAQQTYGSAAPGFGSDGYGGSTTYGMPTAMQQQQQQQQQMAAVTAQLRAPRDTVYPSTGGTGDGSEGYGFAADAYANTVGGFGKVLQAARGRGDFRVRPY